MGHVYALSEDGADFRYVGATQRPVDVRLSNHRGAAHQGKTSPVHRWMRDAGIASIMATSLETVPDEQLAEREAHWIARLRADGYDLLNLTDGGPGRPGFEYTEEQRQQLSEMRRGKPHGKRHEFKDPEAQVASGVLGAHNRWHVGKQRKSATCALCVD